VATPQTRHFPLKEPDARNLFFFHNFRELFVGRRDVGCDRRIDKFLDLIKLEINLIHLIKGLIGGLISFET
jgi:hypothetical protein